ncbi:hypothetical protein COCSUDRAFT_57697 [Coccomyxa subellipsoidea C-169]|uniref:Uncharacterized protein n=1 Tax=Coccomyxa subellipsoidea (strain C-169) TaxID=574566 RepID=I0YQ83_COCSC|nr:hypothetical protein COCSUDRAFT_57697 [Coccomyxa subellipsoidea C-169]EIE20552.1 hypothetical protein COCSUDRAFT_57697 [Coccomyxa subellipsoidea C-169]|eukprot:XP_005645096.1 hypothetical protein COCSUDRAFT_57697 [Coccomyxa subellipsoidea C-169]
MTAAEEEASSECVSNMQPSSGLCYRQRRCPIEACSPCISTELTASKFDGGCRGRFSDAAEAGFRTPLPMCQSADLADGQPQPISAELLLTAQKKLREAYESNIPACPMVSGAVFGDQGAQMPFSGYSAHFEVKAMQPLLMEAQGSWPIGACTPAQPGSLHQPEVLHPQKPRTVAASQEAAAASNPQPRLEGNAPKQRRARGEESDEDTLSSSSSSGSKKRKRQAVMFSSMQPDSWAAELALQRRQLQARVEQLEGYNAHLIRQLSATLRTLRSERANTHAEITRMHQKCAALAAFLPPSVAAFALGNPPEIGVNSRAALLRSHSSP